MTLIKKYDAVLEAVYCISGKRPTFGRILAFLRKKNHDIHWGEVWDILNKMRRDHIIREQIFQNDIKGVDKEVYLIDFEGKLMYERDGLKGKIWRENFTKRRVEILEILTFLVALTTLFYSTCSSNKKDNDTNCKEAQQCKLSTDSMMQLKQKTESDMYPDSNTLSRQLKTDTIYERKNLADTAQNK